MTHPLSEARKSAGLSQKALASLVGCDRVTVARIESGRQLPSVTMINNIQTALRQKDVELSANAFIRERLASA